MPQNTLTDRSYIEESEDDLSALDKWLARIFIPIVLLLVVGSFMVSIFAVRTISTDSESVLVKDPAFKGGQAPVGSVVLVSESEPKMEPGLMKNVVDTFASHPDAKVVTVEAGPNAKVEENEEGLMTVDGRELKGSLDNLPSRLDGEYIVSDDDTLFLVDEAQVLGEVLKRTPNDTEPSGD